MDCEKRLEDTLPLIEADYTYRTHPMPRDPEYRPPDDAPDALPRSGFDELAREARLPRRRPAAATDARQVRVRMLQGAVYSVFCSKKCGYTPRASAVHDMAAADSLARTIAIDAPHPQNKDAPTHRR